LCAVELGYRFGSKGGGTQHKVPDETNKENEMRFGVSLLGNTIYVIKNFLPNLIEFVLKVKNFLNTTTL
jgi:hypothetical protein